MAGLNIPKREQLENGPKLSDLNKARLKAQDRLSDYAERAAVKGADVAFGEDTGDSLLEDLAYGAVPGGSLYQRVKTGTRPGLLDFADFVPGSGAMKAMLPIAVKPTLDAMKAGKRMGKTAKNIAEAREARDFVHRVHRTRKVNTRSIDKQGLLVGDKNKNYGKNTGDTDEYPASVWLGFDPTNVPVLQYYYTHPDTRKELTTYRVRIPRDVYNNTPRVKFEGGRGGRPKIVGKGERSISAETARWTGNDALIDVFSDKIPPEWLSKIPPDEFEKLVKRREHRESLVDLYNKFYGDMEDPITPHNLSDFEHRVLDVKPSLSVRTKPSLIGLPMEGVNDELSESLRMYSGLDGKYRPAPLMKFDEILDRNGIRITRPEEAMQSQRGDWKDLIETSVPASGYTGGGSITRGHLYDDQYGTMQFPSVGDRTYRWDVYRAKLKEGKSPAKAHYDAMPRFAVNWKTGEFHPVFVDVLTPRQQAGAISRPMLLEGKRSPLQQLTDLANKPSDFAFANGHSLSSILQQTNNPSYYLEYFDKRNIPQKDEVYQNLKFTTKPGSIARGNDEWAPKNEILYAQSLRRANKSGESSPDNVLSNVRRGLNTVVRDKDNYYFKTLYDIMNE